MVGLSGHSRGHSITTVEATEADYEAAGLTLYNCVVGVMLPV